MRPIILLMVGLFVSGCKSETAIVPPVVVPQLTQTGVDVFTARNIVSATIDIYNQNVAGRTAINWQGQTVTCPNGGTVKIGGAATSNSSNLTTVDLTYTMTACKVIKAQHTFSYTGVVTEKGSFDGASFESETVKSTGAVAMDGTISVTGYQTVAVTQTVTFTINRSGTSTSGDIAGRTFAY